ncbi:hypothetical protein C1646_811188, partial [Rhizophagus diaphanus]
MDHDKENQLSLNYQPPMQRVPTITSNHPYALRNDLLYSAKEYNDLEILYHKAHEELKRIKLTSISSEKIRLMSNVLYKKQHKDNEKPIYDPEEFKKMLKKLQVFFDEFYTENILVTPMDYPGQIRQKNVRRAVVHRMINGERSDVPPQILNITRLKL